MADETTSPAGDAPAPTGEDAPAPTGEDAPAPAGDRATCTPCRGTGKLISNLGGTPHEVMCSWCDGTGAFQPGHDAQASVAEDRPI